MDLVTDDQLKKQFLGWQCRVRQHAMRQLGGRPTSGMTPRVLHHDGTVLLDAMTVVMIPSEPEEHTKFFAFQVQKTADPKQTYDAVLKVFQGDYFQKPKKFSDTLAAQFAPGSQVAQTLVNLGECLLEFEQFSQTWKLHCTVTELHGDDDVRQHVLAHNRVFNRNVPGDAVVLAMKPQWHSANADPPAL